MNIVNNGANGNNCKLVQIEIDVHENSIMVTKVFV
jgi:hypothetical protein